jgi:hypothetical protein
VTAAQLLGASALTKTLLERTSRHPSSHADNHNQSYTMSSREKHSPPPDQHKPIPLVTHPRSPRGSLRATTMPTRHVDSGSAILLGRIFQVEGFLIHISVPDSEPICSTALRDACVLFRPRSLAAFRRMKVLPTRSQCRHFSPAR